MTENEKREGRPYTDEAWDAAPIGSTRAVNMTTGEWWIYPAAKPVSAADFVARRPPGGVR